MSLKLIESWICWVCRLERKRLRQINEEEKCWNLVLTIGTDLMKMTTAVICNWAIVSLDLSYKHRFFLTLHLIQLQKLNFTLNIYWIGGFLKTVIKCSSPKRLLPSEFTKKILAFLNENAFASVWRKLQTLLGSATWNLTQFIVTVNISLGLNIIISNNHLYFVHLAPFKTSESLEIFSALLK
jgi:hypothetical protein